VICPGFAVDCLETLEEIAMTNQAIFKAAGGKNYAYIPALNDTPAQIELMQALIASAVCD
jgi:ferrochelatase